MTDRRQQSTDEIAATLSNTSEGDLIEIFFEHGRNYTYEYNGREQLDTRAGNGEHGEFRALVHYRKDRNPRVDEDERPASGDSIAVLANTSGEYLRSFLELVYLPDSVPDGFDEWDSYEIERVSAVRSNDE